MSMTDAEIKQLFIEHTLWVFYSNKMFDFNREGSTGLIIDLEFDHSLNDQETSYAAWALSEILTTGNPIGSLNGTDGDGLQLTPFDTRGDALTLVSEGQHGEQILGECHQNGICPANTRHWHMCMGRWASVFLGCLWKITQLAPDIQPICAWC